MKGKFKRIFIWNRIFFVIIKVFTITFDQFNASLLNKSWILHINYTCLVTDIQNTYLHKYF